MLINQWILGVYQYIMVYPFTFGKLVRLFSLDFDGIGSSLESRRTSYEIMIIYDETWAHLKWDCSCYSL